MMAPPGHRAAGVAVALSVVCKHSNAPAARAIQPEACARVGRRGAVERDATRPPSTLTRPSLGGCKHSLQSTKSKKQRRSAPSLARGDTPRTPPVAK